MLKGSNLDPKIAKAISAASTERFTLVSIATTHVLQMLRVR